MIFLKTAYYGLALVGKSENMRLDVKQEWAQMVLKSFNFELEICGTEPKNLAAILVGNHISFLDVPALMAAHPKATFIAKSEVRSWPVIGAGAAAAGTIFVQRKNLENKRSLYNQLAQVLKNENKNIAVFPAGTTSLYESQAWKKGIFKMAQQSKTSLQVFRLDYRPLRESAYIDDDKILTQMRCLLKIPNKKIRLTWLENLTCTLDPAEFAEDLRQKVIASGLHGI